MIDWQGDLQDQLIRDYINADKFVAMCSKAGIGTDTTVVFYGDKSNWWACYAFWAFKLFGHPDCRILNGGRKLWLDQGRPTSTEKPHYPPRSTRCAAARNRESASSATQWPPTPRQAYRSLMSGVPRSSPARCCTWRLIRRKAPPRRTHPGRQDVPWSRAVNEDGTFKSVEELKAIYEDEVGLKPSDNVVAYCRIGERSSLTWFVLTYLLGYANVKNYDGSWTEWGNLVRAPIAKGA